MDRVDEPDRPGPGDPALIRLPGGDHRTANDRRDQG
jgi:hypothetical protein